MPIRLLFRLTFSFCERHPQYVKFFTQESKLHLNYDARITAKFEIIMESLGYLLLDFNKKPKQLDRLVGYIAMVHKDMRLVEQDMRVRRAFIISSTNDKLINFLRNFNAIKYI